MRIRDGQPGCARQAPTALPGRGLLYSIREAEIIAGGRQLSQAGNHLRADGCRCVRDERHRLRQEDEFGQSRSFKALQKRIADPTALYPKPTAKGCGNDGPVGSVGNRKQVSHPSHRPLEISPTTRDFHIPTAWLAPDGKVENQNQVSHFPPRGSRPSPVSSFQNQKPRKESAAPRPPSRHLQNPSISETRHRFMLIFNWKMLRVGPKACSRNRENSLMASGVRHIVALAVERCHRKHLPSETSVAPRRT